MEYLIDANLPARFSIWNHDKYIHQSELGESWTDDQIWEYAQKHNLTIVTKDSDFSDKIKMSNPPPRVIHIKLGNMRLSELHSFLSRNWEMVTQLSYTHKLVNVHRSQVFGID